MLRSGKPLIKFFVAIDLQLEMNCAPLNINDVLLLDETKNIINSLTNP